MAGNIIKEVLGIDVGFGIDGDVKLLEVREGKSLVYNLKSMSDLGIHAEHLSAAVCHLREMQVNVRGENIFMFGKTAVEGLPKVIVIIPGEVKR